MVLIISDDDIYPEVKINNFTSVYSIYLKQGFAQGVTLRRVCIAGTLTSAGDHSPDGWIPTTKPIKKKKKSLCLRFVLSLKWTVEFLHFWSESESDSGNREISHKLQQWSSCAPTPNRPEDGLIIECVVMCWVTIINLCVVEFFLSSAGCS